MVDRHLYTIGWICAITTELIAARAFLDEKHDPPKERKANDPHNYELGKIADHYVVIVCLPEGEYGTTSAAEVATSSTLSFPNIRFGLMVGIGGGAPTNNHDIRLGDVVVGIPGNGEGGTFAYDFEKKIQNQTFVKAGFLDQPPKLLRAVIPGLKASYKMHGHRLNEAVNEALQKHPRLKEEFSRPRTADRLYKSTFTHVSEGSKNCLKCGNNPSNLIQRHPRQENEDNSAIHYGLIASANKLMKDAITRDKLAAEYGVLCFDMEAAGLMNRFPCLVIRGICDYADTHKNDEWQGFAAMISAAYARDLLGRFIPEERQERENANDIVENKKAEAQKTDEAYSSTESLLGNFLLYT
ncbi:hypothetical protein THAR02_00899 [Trichoderma harzianum]|uniref:Uncharacterized protein n=1 Tax=Trichoderma harzianum TaxID=5544 RepID=A0A0F9XRJ7_TRIHA|nr:hypothetical protein THAR02_00899 [Trichoderma harzianum]